MLPTGVELIVGLVRDPQFGPIVACAASGAQARLLHDVSVRLPPLGREEAIAMVRELRSAPLLGGALGEPARDIAAIADVLVRLGALAEDLPEVAELDCDPLLVLEQGAVILDAHVRLEPAEQPLPLGARA
jgi:acetyl-CoA synthetase (ADP-forming)